MIKIISSFFLFVLSCQLSFGKAVDEITAKKIGYSFLKSEGVVLNSPDLSLVYTATSTIDGATVTDFYVFNSGASGFVMISGDDNITPVLAYSTESVFNTGNIPAHVSSWLNGYKNQVNYAISHKVNAPAQTAKWDVLLQSNGVKAAGKTTAGGIVAPLLHTTWDQAPNYNVLCPYDAAADTNAITGCVATAMAQVMKYWKWPKVGKGSHSYFSPYGMLSATFEGTVYKWDSMKNYISKPDSSIGLLMLHAGISVNMNYSVTESGAYVNIDHSPVTNCAQYALQTYFGYKSTVSGLSRDSYSDTEWVHFIKAEVEAGRPVIYTGFGSSGGHCFIADGYTTGNRIHINWGWGGANNGYFIVENLSPGSQSFTNGQTLMIGIEPDSSLLPHEPHDTTIIHTGITQLTTNSISIYPNPASDIINIDLAGVNATKASITDMQGRVVKSLALVSNGKIAIAVNDLSAGIYFMTLQTEQGVLTKKIVITH